ncbi:MAG: divalent-cation tolerance protein CutA [Elusimicrobiales bacterium]|nr:divalent-cation tolerance protein CutA [Elusimicrobiales bacterium]
MSTRYDICLVTAGSRAAARKLASGLLRERLAACVSAVPGVESSYWWQGRLERASEVLLLVKTRRALRKEVMKFVKRHHPYAVPEVLFAEIAAGSPEYLAWLGANTVLSAKPPEGKAPETKK